MQALHGAGVQPRVAAAEGDDGERPLPQVHLVERGDLQLAALGRLDLVRLGGDVARVKVQADDGVGALGSADFSSMETARACASNSTTPKRSGSSTW